jgi:hypothetical protein
MNKSLWRDYRVNWQNYSRKYRAYWEQHKVSEGEIDYWISLRVAQKAYCRVQGTYNGIRDGGLREAQDIYYKKQEEYGKKQEEYVKARREYY